MRRYFMVKPLRQGTAAYFCVSGLTAMLLFGASPASAQVAPPLGLVQQFGALGAAGVTGQAGGGAAVNGDVGSNPTPAISNFPPSTVLVPFTLHTVIDPTTTQAQLDATAAYNALAIQGTGTVLADNLATVGPLTSGVYSFTVGAPDLPVGATLTLNGPGIFVFNVASTLTANVTSVVAGTANPCNVYWRVGSSATLNGNNFFGTVIANASVTLGDIVGPAVGTHLTGRAVALTGAVTMAGDGGTTVGGCSNAVAPPASGSAVPSLSKWAQLGMGLLLAGVAVWLLRRSV
jgi:Ice-binding-like